MKLKNGANDQVVGDSFKHYTGLTNVKIVAINPTMEELIAMEIPAKQEPSYTSTTANGAAKIRLDFHGQNVDGYRNKITFWLEAVHQMNKDGNKTQFIDKYGKTAWAEELSTLPNFVDADSCRPAYVGEEDLMRFIAIWTNSKIGEDEVVLDTINNIVSKGDIKELRQLVRDAKDYATTTLNGMTFANAEGKQFPTVYTKWFGRPYLSSTTYLTKTLNNQYTQFKADYQGSFEWKEFNLGASSVIAPDAPVAQAAAAKDDGLPF